MKNKINIRKAAIQLGKEDIIGNDIVVYSDKVAETIAVRYARAANHECNLVNSKGLPVVPFRTDDWKGITQKLN